MLITFLAFTVLCHAETNKPSIKTVITEKRIIVTSGKTSDQDFKTLINETVEQYKDRPGIQIIVKASRHKTFNYKTPDAFKPEYISFKIISSDEKSDVGDTDKLQPEPIKFTKEKDTIPTDN
jgi:hypothetical protein